MAVKASAAVTLSTVVDVSGCTRYYLLQSSTLAQPSRPLTNPPGGSWDDSEPTYTSGSTNSLYFCDLTVFSDGTFHYSAVSLSSAYEAAKEAYNRATAAQTTANRALSNTEVIVGTQTKASGSWTGVASFSSLVDGQQIVYWLPFAGSGNATLNLTLSNGTTTGAKNCYYSGTTRITTHYAAGNVIHLTYRENAVIGGNTYTGWWADANYVYNTHDQIQFNNTVYAKSAISAVSLVVGDAEGYFRLGASVSFDISKPILYTSAAIGSGKTSTKTCLAMYSVAMATVAGAAWSGVEESSVYLVGTLSGQTFTVSATDWITCSPVNGSGALTYILLGKTSSVTPDSMFLYPEHPIYRFVNNVFTAVSDMAYEAYINAEQNAANISSLVQRVNEVDLKLTDEAIIGVVRGSAAYQNDINYTPRFEALQTQITQALTSIDLRVSKAELETYMRLVTAGILIGKSNSIYNLLLDDNALHIQQSGADISLFQKNQLTVENIRLSSPSSSESRYSLRTAPDGGLMFTVEG